MKPPVLSVILPLHDQANHLIRVFQDYASALEALGISYEVVFVANACRDESPDLVRSLAEDFPVRLVELEERGWGLAVKHGLRAARGDIVCYTNFARTSADDLVETLKPAIDDRNRVFTARRGIRDNWMRKWGSLLYNLECRFLFGLSHADINGTPKVFPRRFDRLLALDREDDLIDLEFNVICGRAGYPLTEIPIASSKRHGGRSTTNFRSAFNMYYGALKFYFQTRKWKRNGS